MSGTWISQIKKISRIIKEENLTIFKSNKLKFQMNNLFNPKNPTNPGSRQSHTLPSFYVRKLH